MIGGLLVGTNELGLMSSHGNIRVRQVNNNKNSQRQNQVVFKSLNMLIAFTITLYKRGYGGIRNPTNLNFLFVSLKSAKKEKIEKTFEGHMQVQP